MVQRVALTRGRAGRPRRRALLAALVIGGLSAHIRPRVFASGRSEAVFELQIEKRKLVGGVRTLRVRQGDSVVLRWKTDEPMAVHIHGYNAEAELVPGEAVRMVLAAYATGRFPVEVHLRPTAQRAKERGIVLLYLEVLPP